MDNWLLLAIGGAFCVGTFGILQKIEAESKINRNAFIFYSHVGMAILGLILLLLSRGIFYIDGELLLLGLVTNFLYILVLKLRLICLKSMTSSSYFINYRIFTSIGLLFGGQIFFLENINFKEYLGIFLGFIVFYLLIEKKNKNEKHIELEKGYMFLIISVILAVVVWLVQKMLSVDNFNLYLYTLYCGIIGMFITIGLKGKDSLYNIVYIKNKKNFIFLFFSGLVFGGGFLFNMSSFKSGGDVAIVYKIMSYSLFMPIFFSILVYKEKVTLKKITAFILTIISILLFV